MLLKNIILRMGFFNFESHILKKICNIPLPSTVIPIPLLHRPWNSAAQFKQRCWGKEKCYFQYFGSFHPKLNLHDFFPKQFFYNVTNEMPVFTLNNHLEKI